MKDTRKFIQIEDFFSHTLADFFKFLKYCLYGVFIYLDINHNQSFILLVFFAIDMGLGSWKSLALGIPLEKSIFWTGLMKKLLVLVLPMIVALLGKGLGYNFKILVDATMKILILQEFISCLANFLSIRTKQDIRNQDFVALLANVLQDLAQDNVKKIINIIRRRDDTDSK